MMRLFCWEACFAIFKTFFSSSRSQIFLKSGVLKYFANFTGKHYAGVFVIKLQDLVLAVLLKRDSNTGVSCEICEICKNTFFFPEHLWWLFLVFTYPPLNFISPMITYAWIGRVVLWITLFLKTQWLHV